MSFYFISPLFIWRVNTELRNSFVADPSNSVVIILIIQEATPKIFHIRADVSMCPDVSFIRTKNTYTIYTTLQSEDHHF